MRTSTYGPLYLIFIATTFAFAPVTGFYTHANGSQSGPETLLLDLQGPLKYVRFIQVLHRAPLSV